MEEFNYLGDLPLTTLARPSGGGWVGGISIRSIFQGIKEYIHSFSQYQESQEQLELKKLEQLKKEEERRRQLAETQTINSTSQKHMGKLSKKQRRQREKFSETF